MYYCTKKHKPIVIIISSALSISTHAEAEGQSASGLGGSGVALIRDGFTARGDWAFSPFNNTTYAKSLFLINLGYNALALMDVINLGVLSNISRQEFLFDADRDKRYHMEKQPQFVEEVASNAFLSVNEALSRFNSPQFLLPPHQERYFVIT